MSIGAIGEVPDLEESRSVAKKLGAANYGGMKRTLGKMKAGTKALKSISGNYIGPPANILCVSADVSQNALAEFLPDRETARAHSFHFQRFGASRLRDLSPSFWKRLPYAAGLAVDLFHGTPPPSLTFITEIATSDARGGCPILARIPDLQSDAQLTYGHLVAFHIRVCSLEKSDVSVWIDGDIDRMGMWAGKYRFGWRVEYPPTLSWIEQQMNGFLESALRHHQEIWQPVRVHLNVGFR